MSETQNSSSSVDARLVKARAKVLAREDRELKAELIRIRQQAGLTQKQVAEIMGVTQQAINKLERYDSDPKSSTLRRYINAIGAIVEHRVVPDVGQSVWLAAAPQWEGLIALHSEPVHANSPDREAVATEAAWSGARSTDFALAY